jgi:hypothetical protein
VQPIFRSVNIFRRSVLFRRVRTLLEYGSHGLMRKDTVAGINGALDLSLSRDVYGLLARFVQFVTHSIRWSLPLRSSRGGSSFTSLGRRSAFQSAAIDGTFPAVRRMAQQFWRRPR